VLESRAVEFSRVDYITISCIYGFILQEYVLGIILLMSILPNIRASRGVPDYIPNRKTCEKVSLMMYYLRSHRQ